jgi:hypothetical protein
MIVVNETRYPWLKHRGKTENNDGGSVSGDTHTLLSSAEAQTATQYARMEFNNKGAVSFPKFLTDEAIQSAVQDLRRQEDHAFTTDDVHTAYLNDVDLAQFSENSVYNHEMRTVVASTAYDELGSDSVLRSFYHDPRLLRMVSLIVGKELYLSDDPLGCCSVNVFRPGYHHSFHFDESEFSVTLMLQPAEDGGSGLFQYTNPLRHDDKDLALEHTANVIQEYDAAGLKGKVLSEARPQRDHQSVDENKTSETVLHTLDFSPGTLLVLAGSKSLHRVTQIRGNCSRLVAVLTFASKPGFCNSAAVQKMFWGRSLLPTFQRLTLDSTTTRTLASTNMVVVDDIENDE